MKAPTLEESELLTLLLHLNGHQSLLDKLDHCPTCDILIPFHRLQSMQWEYLILLSYFNQNPNVWTGFSRCRKYEISRECVRWESRCTMSTEGGTAMTRLVVAIRNAKAPRNVKAEKETVTFVRLLDLQLLS